MCWMAFLVVEVFVIEKSSKKIACRLLIENLQLKKKTKKNTKKTNRLYKIIMTVAGSAIKLFTLCEVYIFITGLHFKKHKICMIMLLYFWHLIMCSK